MTLNEIEQRLNALQAEKDKLTAELEQLKEVSTVLDWRGNFDDKRYYCGNYYRTRELAEQDAKELALRSRVRQLRDVLCEGYQFVPGGNNWYIIFSVKTAKYETSSNPYFRSIGNIYFDTYEHSQQACDILNAERGKESGE